MSFCLVSTAGLLAAVGMGPYDYNFIIGPCYFFCFELPQVHVTDIFPKPNISLKKKNSE